VSDEAASAALSAPPVPSAALAGEDDGPSDEALAAATQNRNPSFRPGVVIADKYVVERLIGEGGLGVVVAAKHVQLEQMVAIKYLRPKALVSAAVAERFVREARLAAKIRSDHVARVYDVGTLPTGAPYMVMEYLSGMDLGRMLGAMGPLPVWRAVDYMLQACEALGAAHASGIVHSDIKPENLFVTTGASGTPLLKVLDFGIAKLTADRARVEEGQGGEVTVSGELLGTPAYMSPEQLLTADAVDVRTDVWALGVVLYQLLSGRLPFDGESLPELCAAIVNKHAVPLSDVRGDVPPLLARSVERCLAKSPDDRFQNVADLRFELLPFAAASREQRVSQALRTLDATDQGRPPTPLPDELLTRALRAAPVPTFEEDRWVSTTPSGVTSQAPSVMLPVESRPPARRRSRKGRRLLAIGAVAAVAGALIVAATAGSSDHSSPEAPAVPPAATAIAPPKAVPEVPTPTAIASSPPLPSNPAPVAAPPPPLPKPVAAGVAPGPVAAAPQASAGPLPPARTPGPPHAHPASTVAGRDSSGSTSHAKTGSPTTTQPADPNAVINPFD
jgi:serine/threonine protein kinase